MGHHDGRGNTQDTCRQGDALGVIAGRKRHHAGFTLALVETGQCIKSTAELESAHALIVLALEEHLGTQLSVQRT
ncbi:hypothetical protein D3C76_1059120 [compost metagenome]